MKRDKTANGNGERTAGHAVSAWRRAIPLAALGAAVLAAILVILGLAGRRTSRRSAEDRLKAAAADIVESLDCCVDAQLAFVGQEVCRRYGSPRAMEKVDLAALMRTYFVDEINVVNEKGLCIASTVPEIVNQDQWSLHNPALFCKALIDGGKDVFSQPFRESATERNIFRKYVGVAFPKPAKGYIQIGFERSRLNDTIDYRLKSLAHDWHIGETGFYVISKTRNGDILSAGREKLDGRSVADVGFDVFAARQRNNVDRRDPTSRAFLGFERVSFFKASYDGEPCLCTTGVVDQFHRYVAALPLAEVYGPFRRMVATVGAVLFVVLALVVFFLSRDLAAKARQREKEKARLEKDLTLARTIQTSSLTAVFPESPDWAVRARMDTAREVGGDFYDFYTLPSGRACVLVADVSGKGVPAALFMMRAKATLRAAIFARPDDLAAAVAEANDALAEKNEAEMFVTAWIGVYDAGTRTLEYVNAGHNPPIVRHADGSVSWMRERSGLVLAAMAGGPYRLRRQQLAAGDSMLLYTDGVTEAMNGAGEQYGERRLESVVAAPGSDLIAAVRADVTIFVSGAEPSDDITMVAFDVTA